MKDNKENFERRGEVLGGEKKNANEKTRKNAVGWGGDRDPKGARCMSGAGCL